MGKFQPCQYRILDHLHSHPFIAPDGDPKFRSGTQYPITNPAPQTSAFGGQLLTLTDAFHIWLHCELMAGCAFANDCEVR
jgi:hypothetical protein